MFRYIRAAAFAYVGEQFLVGAFFAAAVNPLIKAIKSIEIQGALRTLAAGAASRLGGGKFASGATLAAMGFLFNEVLHQEGDKGNMGSTAQKTKVIDSTSEAVDHYFNGNGESVELGPNTKNALRNHPLVQGQSESLRTGTANHLNDNLNVDLRGGFHHVGKTRVDFSTACQSGACTTTYVGFSNDGFWDPRALRGGGGIGGGCEIPGGTGYRYNSYRWSETHPDRF